jgi:hypothetical protein
MSLKAFHIVFIIASILLAFLFSAWALASYFRGDGPVLHLIFGIGSLLSGMVLIAYSKYFLRKLKDISYL